MEVGSEVSLEYLKLGLAGAALLILVIFVVLLFAFVKYNSKQLTKIIGGNTNDKVDKLCDKIDSLVTVIHTQLTTNSQDQKMVIQLLNQNVNIGLDTQRRVVRIDDRTFLCRGNPGKDVVTELHRKTETEVAASVAAIEEKEGTTNDTV